jgi:hypothetical protein
MPVGSAQQVIDTRALEVASAALGRVQSIEERLDAREAIAKKHRAELRADMMAGFRDVKEELEGLGEVLHGRVSKLAEARHRFIIRLSGSVIVSLLGVTGFLFIRAAGWS